MKGILSASLIAIFTATALNVTPVSSADKDAKPASGATSAMPGAMNPQQMQQSMMQMHDLMHRIPAAKTPEERQKLQQQHMQLMQSHMQAMITAQLPRLAPVRAAARWGIRTNDLYRCTQTSNSIQSRLISNNAI